MRRRALIAALFAAILFGSLNAAEAIKSGPQPGTKDKPSFLPSSFQVLSVTPEKTAGRFRSPLSDFGLNPAVIIFTRADPSQLDKADPLAGLVKNLDDLVAKHTDVQLGVCVVFMDDGGYREALENKADDLAKAIEFKDRRVQQIKDFAKNIGLEHVALGIGSVAGPKDYGISEKAELTILVCNQLQIMANFVSTDRKDLNAKGIISQVEQLVPAKK